MKKIFLIAGAVMLVSGSVLYGVNSRKNAETPCPNTAECICDPAPCICTPDCQPGDSNCICPVGCEK